MKTVCKLGKGAIVLILTASSCFGMSYPGSWIDGSHRFRTRNGEIALWIWIPTFSYDQLDRSAKCENNPIRSHIGPK